MTETYNEVLALAEQKGHTVAGLCKAAGVNYMTVWKWQRKEPKQFTTLRKLREAPENTSREYVCKVRTDQRDLEMTILASSSEEAENIVRDAMDDNEFIETIIIS